MVFRTKSHELDPTANRLSTLAFTLNKAGRAKEALALLEPALDDAGDDRPFLTRSKSLALAWLGRPKEGIALLDEQLLDRPGDSETLDFSCWYRGMWNAGMETALDLCGKAVTAANYSASALHSRAVVNLRLAKLDAARADIDAAIDLDPSEEDYLLTRGLIRTQQGDLAGGRSDIAEVMRRHQTLALMYRAGGLMPAK